MKKTLFGLVTFLLILFLAACGGSNDNDSSESENTDSGSENTEEATEEEAGGDDIQEITVKISHVVAENTPKHVGAQAFKEYAEAESDGKITVELYPNGSLFGDTDEYQNLVSNNAQYIIRDMSKLVGNNPKFNIPALPFAFPAGDEAAVKFWDGEMGQDILHSLESDGAIGVAMWQNGGKHITNNEHEITAPEDLEGLKFRTQGGQVLEAVYDQMNAGSESIPFAELYTALDQGVVEGQENTFSNIESKKFDEVQDFMTIMNHSRVDYAFLTNTEFYDSLNDATMEIIKGAEEAATEAGRGAAAELNAEGLELLKERGEMKITELTDEQLEVFKDTLQPIWDQFEDEIGADTYEAIRAANE